jgi:hypothetical protein
MSLWGDEDWSLHESVSGRFQRDLTSADLEREQGTLYWEELTWSHTLWRYETTNHHFLYAIFAKASNSLWRQATQSQDHEFSESALRIAPLLFGLAGLALWARVLRPLSLTAACLFPILMAVHPWFIRYISEGRGYALLFALLPALYLSLRAAVASTRLRAWIPMIISQTLLVYAWPGMLLTTIGIQIAVGVALYRKRELESSPTPHWALANLCTAMLLLQIVAPCIPQIWEYLANDVPYRPSGGFWLTNELSRFAIGCEGIDAIDYVAANPLFISAQGLLDRAPIRTLMTFVLLFGAFVLGVLKWLRKAELGATFFCGVIGASVFAYALAALTGTALYQWYFVHLLPFVFALISLGLAVVIRRISYLIPRGDTMPTSGRMLLRGAIFFAPVALYALTVAPQIHALRSHPLDPRRESVALSRLQAPLEDPIQLETITAHCQQPSLTYDPHGWQIRKASSPPDSEDGPGLVQLMRLADSTDAELWVNVGAVDILTREHPRIAKMLASPDLFTPPKTVHGLEPQFIRHLYRYRGGMFDFLKSR